MSQYIEHVEIFAKLEPIDDTIGHWRFILSGDSSAIVSPDDWTEIKADSGQDAIELVKIAMEKMVSKKRVALREKAQKDLATADHLYDILESASLQRQAERIKQQRKNKTD